jgi:hypothetical protein
MANTYTLIQGETTTSNASSYTFSAIPATYTDLVLKTSIRSQYTGAVDFNVIINGVTTGTLYSTTYLNVFGGSPASGRYSNRNLWEAQNSLESNSATASTFGSIEIYIPNYLSADNKIASISLAAEDNASGFSGSGTGNAMESASAHLLRSTSTITSIKIDSPFLSGSSFYLYGIKNS